MNKVLLLLLLCLAFTENSTAIGLDGFIIGTNFTSYPGLNNTVKPGVTLGLLGIHPLRNHFSFTFQVLYQYKNGSIDGLLVKEPAHGPVHSVSAYQIDYRMNLLEIPVSLKYNIYDDNHIRLYATAGAGYSFVFSDNALIQRLYWDDDGRKNEFDASISDGVSKSTNNGPIYVAGIGAEFSLLVLECCYQRAGYHWEPTDAFILAKKNQTLYLTLVLKIL